MTNRKLALFLYKMRFAKIFATPIRKETNSLATLFHTNAQNMECQPTMAMMNLTETLVYIEFAEQALARLKSHLTGKPLTPEPLPKRPVGRPQVYQSKKERVDAQEIRRKARVALRKLKAKESESSTTKEDPTATIAKELCTDAKSDTELVVTVPTNP
jgi:hypothetical protein